MRRAALLLLILPGCTSAWDAVDADGDSVSAAGGDCWDNPEGPEGTGLDGADIHPGANETWYDGVDQDCADDEDFDADGDGFVPDAWVGSTTLRVEGSGARPGGDCWDDPAVTPAEYTVVPGSLADRAGTRLAWTQPLAADVNPAAMETWYDDVDQDCEGDDDLDQDLDGFRTWAYPDRDGAFGDDCLDGAPLDTANEAGDAHEDVNPEATETWYDGTDQDCDGNDCDADGDTYDHDGLGEGWCSNEECDDTDPESYPDPEVVEVWYNGVDENCDGNDGDADDDTWWVEDYETLVEAAGGEPLPLPAGDSPGDCDDTDPAVNPGETETWYDGTDADCTGGSDFDADADTYDSDAYGGEDCDDADASVNPGVLEVWYDGEDVDCSGGSDYDYDSDGHDSDAYGGDDCDDADAAINPGEAETWYDGTDADCAGGSDYDADADSYDSDAYGGDDCDDADDAVHPDQPDDETTPLLDDDCDGYVDEDAVSFGSIVLNEVNKKSSAGGTDAYVVNPPANWFELYNTESFDIDLSNWVFTFCRETDIHETPAWADCDAVYEVAVSPDAGLVVPPDGYVVLCQSDDPTVWSDPTECDYAYTDATTWTGTGPDGADYADADATFEAEGGIIEIALAGSTVDDVTWWYINAGQTWPIAWNKSMCLLTTAQDATLNDDQENWDVTSASAKVIWATDPTNNWGTPGEANTLCP